MKKLLSISILTFFFAYNLAASPNATVTYYSTSNGDWTDPIWSTVSHTETTGLVSLPCSFTGKDEVRMRHNITSSCTVLNLGDLFAAGTTDIVLDNGASFTVMGDLNLAGTHMTYVQPSSVLTINGDLSMVGTSDIVVDGTLLVNGNVNLSGNAQVCGTGTATYTGTLNISGSAVWCSSLPIELLYFTAKEYSNRVQLEWATALELNNDFFTVERSLNGYDFEIIAKVEGAGTSTEISYYEVIDELPIIGENYYRVKQTDFDGTTTYSPIQEVTIMERVDINAYPNPVKGNVLNLKGHVDLNMDQLAVQIHNLLGEVVYTQIITTADGYLFANVDVTHILAGVYAVTVMNADGQEEPLFKTKIIVE